MDALKSYEIDIDYSKEPLKAFRLIEIQLGYGLVGLVDKELGTPLSGSLKDAKNHIEGEFGLPIPAVYIHDNMSLNPYEYVICFSGFEVGRFCGMKPDDYLCIDTGEVKKPLNSDFKMLKDPAFGRDAFIAEKSKVKEAEKAGYTVCPTHILISIHLEELVKKNLTRFSFLTTAMTQNVLYERLMVENPELVYEVFVHNKFSQNQFKQLLNLLLEERISIADLNTIVETVADNADRQNDLSFLLKKVREKLAYQIILKCKWGDEKIYLIAFSDKVNKELESKIFVDEEDKEHPLLQLEIAKQELLIKKIAECCTSILKAGNTPILVTLPDVRKPLSMFVSHVFEELTVVSTKELSASNLELKFTGIIDF